MSLPMVACCILQGRHLCVFTCVCVWGGVEDKRLPPPTSGSSTRMPSTVDGTASSSPWWFPEEAAPLRMRPHEMNCRENHAFKVTVASS